jgi:hypothetical protein
VLFSWAAYPMGYMKIRFDYISYNLVISQDFASRETRKFVCPLTKGHMLSLFPSQTGRSKSYAFVEFSSSSVAQIVAETMDNYLLAGRILRCKVIPKDQIHPELWVGANRKWRVVPRDRITREAHNKVLLPYFRPIDS